MTLLKRPLLLLALLFASCGLAWAVETGDPGPALACRRLGAALILGAALMAPLLAWRPRTAGCLLELLAVAICGAGLAGLAGTWGLEDTQAVTGAAVVAVTWLLLYCISLPLRAFGAGAMAPLAVLLLLAGLLGTPYLAAPSSGALPDQALEWNPLVRLQHQIAGVDWLRGPLLYPVAGARYFRYPSDWKVLWQVAGICGACLALSLVGLQIRHGARGPSSPETSPPEGPAPVTMA